MLGLNLAAFSNWYYHGTRAELGAVGGLHGSPVIGSFFVVQIPDASDVRTMTVSFRPNDRIFLALGCVEDMVRVVFDHKVVNATSLRAPFRSRFNINDRHASLPVPRTDGFAAPVARRSAEVARSTT